MSIHGKYTGKVSGELIEKARSEYVRYRSDKANLTARVRDNMRLYKAAYAAMYDEKTNQTTPKTAYILSAVENKYADYLDNFPAPNFLAREDSDEETARVLSKIVPAQLEMSGFSKAYKKDVRQKLINGTGIYGVFYDRKTEEIIVNCIDFLNVFCDMNVTDVQKSQFLFITDVIENERLREAYPQCRELFDGDAYADGYINESRTLCDSSEVVDCYYKKQGAVHLIKFCREQVICASEDIYPEGLYKHGLYPVIFDVMYPEGDNPFGFGLVDTTKNPQMYIDKLDGAILKNAMLSATSRWFVNRNANINTQQFADVSNEIIEAGNISEEAIRRVEMGAIPAAVMQHRNQKILELKEVAANRDVSAGSSSGGVTAASAITALQEAGDKQSRAIISDSFDAYKEVVKMVVELMRQFFDRDRVYRVSNEDGTNEYREFSRERLIAAKPERDALGFPIGTKWRNIEFDISIVPQKQNAFRRETNNQTILALWNGGFFMPQNLEISAMVLPFFQFDGKDAVVAAVGKKLEELTKAQQAQEQQGDQIAQQAIPAESLGEGE